MASDLSSGCTEVNDILDDEKEEGEISLEDVSSSEEGPTYKFLPRVFGQCRYCLSMQHCATWCSSLTVNKNNFKRGLQGKENRSKQHYHKDGLDVPVVGGSSGSKSIPYISTTLQEKNDDDALITTINNDLVPISSDSDMEVVGLRHEKHEKKPSHRRKLRKKRRKKSTDSLSLSLSPSSQDLTLSIKDSIHRIETDKPTSGHSKYRHHSPTRKKLISRPSPPSRRHRSPLSKRPSRRRSRSPLRKTSLVRSRKIDPKKDSPTENASPEKKSFNKLLKKVRKLEPSSRSKETKSSLKDKLNNIIKNDKKETSPPIVEKSKESSPEATSNEETKAVKDKEEAIKATTTEEKRDEVMKEDIVSRQLCLETKENKDAGPTKPEGIKINKPLDGSSLPPHPPLEPPPPLPPPLSSPLPPEPSSQPEPELQESQQKSDHKTERKTASNTEDKAENATENKGNNKAGNKLPNFCIDDNDEDLELRMIALRSAVIKKHRTRIASGRRKKPEVAVARIESPFTSTFIEDFPMLAEICSPTSPLSSKPDILSAEDMDLDSDMELGALSGPEDQSPYSPSDDITGELLLEHEILQPVPVTPSIQMVDNNRNLYSPSNPTETPALTTQKSSIPAERNNLNGSILELASQESRPYSPSDATFYDPDLPGVHSSVIKSTAVSTTTTSTFVSMPLQPPPMPPLSMFGSQQPMLLGCPPNMLNAFVDPLGMVPSPIVSSFPTLHQSVNPMLLPNAPPIFTFATPQSTTVPTPLSTLPLPSIPSTSVAESNELDDFMETDLDGSPLVPIEKDCSEQRWPMLGEPLYLQNVPELTQSEFSKIPTLVDRSLVPAAVLRFNKQLQRTPIKKSTMPVVEPLFKNADMRPVALQEELDVRTPNFKPIKLQPQLKKSVIAQPAPAFNFILDDLVEKEKKLNKSNTDKIEKEKSQTSSRKRESERSDRKRKNKKSVSKQRSKELDSKNRRKDLSRGARERSFRQSRAKSVSKNIVKNKRSEETAKKEVPSRSDDKKRRCSIDDDEEALRESLLASIAKKTKGLAATEKPLPSVKATETKTLASTEIIPKSTDEMPLAERVSAFLAQSKEKDLKHSLAAAATAASTSQLKATSQPTSAGVSSARKIVKRVSSMTPASKVVNNAKRYQNLLLQRKLTQQIGSAAIKSQFKLSHSRSASPVIAKSNGEFQKIIINLNEDSESESEGDEAKHKISKMKDRPLLNIPTTDFEKSVDQFLKNARLQQELASTAKSDDVVPPEPVKKALPPMDPPLASVPNVSKAVTTNAGVTTAKITIASSPVIGSVGNIIATTADVVGMAKDTVFNSPKVTKITTKLPNVTATPTAVKHLTESTQEEYRRLKQILQQRTKAKESTSATTQPQSTLDKTTVTPTSSPLSSSSSSTSSSSLSLSTICASPALASTTPNTIAKPVIPPVTTVVSSLPIKPSEGVLVQNKSVPKTQLTTTISPVPKPGTDILKTCVAPSKPLRTVVTTTKIIHTIPSVSQNNIALKKTIPAATNVLINKANTTANPKVSASTIQVTPPNNNAFINNQQAALLGKMSEALSSQNKQISAVAQKVSSLRILTKEQINLKTSRIQETKPNFASNVVMDDLNKIVENNQSNTSKRFSIQNNKLHSTKSIESTSSPSTLNNYLKKDSSNSHCPKISSTEALSVIDKTKQNLENFKEAVNDEVQAISNLSVEKQKELLSKNEENLIEKRRSVVDDIAEMSLKLREWEIERDLQYKYNEEAKKLREELKKVEEKIQQQKNKLNTIHPQVSLYHKKINNGRKECFKLSKLCNSLGQHIIGSEYNVPTAGAEVLNNRIKEIVKHTHKLQNKKTQYVETVSNNSGKSDDMSLKKNSKPANNLKRKEIVESNNLNNNKTDEITSNCMSMTCASQSKESLIINDKVNTCLNEENFNPTVENNAMNTSVEELSPHIENIITNSDSKSTLTKHINPVLNLNNSVNLETVTKSNSSSVTLTMNPIVNFKAERLSVDLNNDHEINQTNQILNTENNEQLRENKNAISHSEDTENFNLLVQNNLVNTISAINSESKPVTGEINLNDSYNKKSVIQSSKENSAVNATNNETQSLLTVVPITKTISNLKNSEVINIENPTLQSTSFENNTIKIENEKIPMECMEIPISTEENKSIEAHGPNLNNTETSSEELTNKFYVQKMETDSDNVNNLETQSSSNANNYQSNTRIDNPQLMEAQNEARAMNIKFEALNQANNTFEISSDAKNLNSVNIIPVPELSEEIKTKLFPKKKSRNVKSVIKKKPTKGQQRKIYYKQMKQHLMEAENVAKSLENSQKIGIQPYESVLKPLRAQRNGNNASGFMCPFEMQGTCNDRDCKYVHGPLR